MIKTQNKLVYGACSAAILLALSACGGSNSDAIIDGGISGTGDPTIEIPGNSNTLTPTEDNRPATDRLEEGSNAGLLSTATPEFTWNAVENADAYIVALTDSAGNEIEYKTGTEACAGTSCSAKPTLAFHNNTMQWRVDALSNDQILQSTATGTYNTPISLQLTPETSDAANCSVWPSISYDNFIVLDNIWNNGTMYNTNWTQSIAATQTNDGTTKPTWRYDWLSEANGPRSAVKAYPEIIYGNKLGTHVSGSKEQTGLPELVSDLPEFEVEFAYTETLENDVERNVALESFFHDSCDITGPCDRTNNTRYEMMVWVNNPESNVPGDLAVSGVMIDNRLWDVYIKPRSDPKYIAFTAQTPITDGTLQWNRFVEWTMQWTAENAEARGINALTPDLCMAAIELGTELWWGKGSFTLDKYKITKN